MFLVRQWTDVALFASPVHAGAFLQHRRDGPPDPLTQQREPVYTRESFFDALRPAWLHPASAILTSGRFVFWFRFPAGDGAVEWWSSDVVLANLADALRRKYAAERQATPSRRSARTATTNAFLAWVSQTRALARHAEIGLTDEMVEIMLQAADSVERGLAWPNRHLSSPPQDTRRLLQFYTAAYAWCVDELLDAVTVWANAPSGVSCSYEFFEWPAFRPNAAGRREPMDRAAVIRWMLETPAINSNVVQDEPDETAFIESDTWKMRIKRLNKRVRADRRDAMMADVLDTLRVPPVDHSQAAIR